MSVQTRVEQATTDCDYDCFTNKCKHRKERFKFLQRTFEAWAESAEASLDGDTYLRAVSVNGGLWTIISLLNEGVVLPEEWMDVQDKDIMEFMNGEEE